MDGFRVFLFLWLLVGFESVSFAANAKILILLSQQNKIYGLIDEGVSEKINAEIVELELKGGEDKVRSAVEKIRPVLVIAKGNDAALWARQTLAHIPLVASGVIHQFNPEVFSKMPGVSLDCSLQSYFDFIRELTAAKGKVGLIIDASQPPEFKRQVESLAQKSDLKVYISVVKKANEVSRAIEAIHAEGANVFLMTYNPLIMNPETYKYIIEFSLSHNIVLVTPSRALLKGGGLASLEANYAEIGRRTAEIANMILKDPSLSDRLGLEFPSLEEVSVNQKIAGSIQVNIPSTILKRAVYIHD